MREVDGQWLPTKWRFSDGKQADGYDEVGIEMYGDKGLAGGMSWYKSADHKPSVVFRMSRRRRSLPRNSRSGSARAVCSSIGIPAP